ncbi:hypothetical protein QAD02_012427, partial [Eretmocerus hayati]
MGEPWRRQPRGPGWPPTPLLLLLSLLLLGPGEWGCRGQSDWNCTAVCKCIWGAGKKTAECRDKELDQVPRGLSENIQQLDLTNNRINYLPENAFHDVGLVNLHILVMRECKVKQVDRGAFASLGIIYKIDLTHNWINRLEPGTFNDTERLRTLLLSHNKLQRLDDGLFHDLKYLQRVELSGNQLFQIGQTTFHKLPQLTALLLNSNNLSLLELASFDQLPKLSSLDLQYNPWHCDCRLAPFRDWTLERKLYTRPTACSSPETLAGRAWDETQADEFACAPSIEGVGYELLDESARLWCRASGSPRPYIGWLHRQRGTLGNSTRRALVGPNNGPPVLEEEVKAVAPGYLLLHSEHWANLTIARPGPADRGEYACVAQNRGGRAERNLSLSQLGPGYGGYGGRGNRLIGLPLAAGLALVALLALIAALALCLCYCQKRRRAMRDEKGAEASSLDQHGLGEQEKSLITAINPVVKPPRRYEAPSLVGGGGGSGSHHGTEMTELNRTLLDSDSVFADGVGSVVGVLPNGLSDDSELRGRASPDLDSVFGGMSGPSLHSPRHLGSPTLLSTTSSTMHSLPPLQTPMTNTGSHQPQHLLGSPLSLHGSITSGMSTLPRSASVSGGGVYPQYPPDLLAFPSGRRTSSPTASQASTATAGLQQTPTSMSEALASSRLQLPFSRFSTSGGSVVGGYTSAASSPSATNCLGYGFAPSYASVGGPAGFKTLPHPARAASATPYSLANRQHGVLARQQQQQHLAQAASPSAVSHYMTLPRRPRAPGWSYGPPSERGGVMEPVYDNLGVRSTADGSSKLSLNKNPDPLMMQGLLYPTTMRNRPLPSTPQHFSASGSNSHQLTLPRAPRSAPLKLNFNRSAPEGASEWPVSPSDREQPQPQPRQSPRSQQPQQQAEELHQQQEPEQTQSEQQSQEPSMMPATTDDQEAVVTDRDDIKNKVEEQTNENVEHKDQGEGVRKEDKSPTKDETQEPRPNSSARKVPPRPPPKPKNKGAKGPLYEDEDEDGTE